MILIQKNVKKRSSLGRRTNLVLFVTDLRLQISILKKANEAPENLCDSVIFQECKDILNPHASNAQKVSNERVFRHFQGEGVEFF